MMEDNLLQRICKENDVPKDLITQLLKESSQNSYENNSEKERIKGYRGLMNYHFGKENEHDI